MYSKVKKCLNAMAVDFSECEWMETHDGLYLSKGFRVILNNETYYIEVKDREIDIYYISDVTRFKIFINSAQGEYVVLFELGMTLGYLDKRLG